MGKNNRKYLQKLAQIPKQVTHYIDPNVARQSSIIFGFKNLNLEKKPFDCSSKHGDSLIYILSTLKVFSQIIRKELELSYPNCHPVPDNQIKDHNLSYFVALAPNNRLHQLGRGRTPERIIGYFDTPNVNLFQICLLDLNHKLSGN